MRRKSPSALACLLVLGACGIEAAHDPAPETTASTHDMARLDELWEAVFAARTELRHAEALLIVDCLGRRGFAVHNLQALTRSWGLAGPRPSEVLAAGHDPGLPGPDEARTYALGHWLDFARAYEDPEGVELLDSGSQEHAEEELEQGFLEADLGDLEPLGDGWEGQSAVDRVRWEIAYQGTAWAQTSKAASLLSGPEWAEVGIPDGGWAPDSELPDPPGGCRGEVLGDLYGDPVRSEPVPGFASWEWGPRLDLESSGADAPAPGSLDEGTRFLSCLAEAGYDGAAFTGTGVFELGEGLRERYYPDATSSDGTSTSFHTSQITDADRQRYEETKAAEFTAAAAVADCDAETGFSTAFAAEAERRLTEEFIAAIPQYEAHLAELEAALETVR